MIKIQGLDHLVLRVRDLSASLHFYVDLLGMEELVKPPILAARGGIWVRAGAQELHCGVEADFKPARKAHPAFSVEHLDDLAARLEGAGHTLTWDDTNPSLRRFFTHDPFGNRLEFVEAR